MRPETVLQQKECDDGSQLGSACRSPGAPGAPRLRCRRSLREGQSRDGARSMRAACCVAHGAWCHVAADRRVNGVVSGTQPGAPGAGDLLPALGGVVPLVALCSAQSVLAHERAA